MLGFSPLDFNLFILKLLLPPVTPDLRGQSALRVGRCWSGEGLEIGRRLGRWTVGKPRPAGWGGSSCAGGREGIDSWAVVEGQHGEGDWFVETPPLSTLRGERVPVSSGWGLSYCLA